MNVGTSQPITLLMKFIGIKGLLNSDKLFSDFLSFRDNRYNVTRIGIVLA